MRWEEYRRSIETARSNVSLLEETLYPAAVEDAPSSSCSAHPSFRERVAKGLIIFGVFLTAAWILAILYGILVFAL